MTCNTGIPLEQSFDISAGNGVTFVVQELDTTVDTTRCEIVLGELGDGYVSTDVCIFQNNAAPALPFDEDGINQCDFLSLPVPSVFVATKTWEGAGADISTVAEFNLSCTNASLDPDGCTIANTVFHEGIPTLSQYGMAIMALLMLGVFIQSFPLCCLAGKQNWYSARSPLRGPPFKSERCQSLWHRYTLSWLRYCRPAR